MPKGAFARLAQGGIACHVRDEATGVRCEGNRGSHEGAGTGAAQVQARARAQQLPPREACWLRAPATRWHSCSWGHSPHTAQTSSTVLLAVLPAPLLSWAQARAQVPQLPQ